MGNDELGDHMQINDMGVHDSLESLGLLPEKHVSVTSVLPSAVQAAAGQRREASHLSLPRCLLAASSSICGQVPAPRAHRR